MPSLHAWRYLFVDLRNDTLRPFENTVIVALVSSTLALVLGTGAGYGLLRFHYRPRLSAILLFTATAVLVIAAMAERVHGLAAIDGASPYRIFWSIVLALATPGLAATFLLVLVFSWNEYLFALFLTSANAQTLPLSIAAQNATRGPMWWYMSVLILIMITPVIAMAIALERYIAKGLLVGALKG